MNTTDVQGTLREMWETRPARPRDDRQVAGVASAIARRYDIDPVLVRVAFVAFAITGIGALLYVAGWAALPERPVEPDVEVRPPRKILMAALVVAAAVSIGTVTGSQGGFLLPTLAAGVLLFLLHHNRGHRVLPPAAPAPEGPSTTGPSLLKEPPATRTPPAWDPLGAAPFAWDLPEPSPLTPEPPRRRRRPVTAVTLAVALLASGVTALVALSLGSLTLATVPVLMGVALAVVGAGLLLGAFLHSGHGLIPVALLLGALTWGSLAVPLDRWPDGDIGEITATPTTVAQLQPSYDLSIGDVTLDLRKLDLTAVPDGSPVRIPVTVGAGDIEVRVAPDTDVTFTGTSGIGEIEFRGQEVSGPGVSVGEVTDLGADGVRSGREVVLDLTTGAGDVEVRRG